MSFGNFETIEQVLAKYPLKVQKNNFLPDITLQPPALFLENLTFALRMQTDNESEMFFREYFIAPFMVEAWKRHPHLQIWSNNALKYDSDLFGEPDYLVSYRDEGVISKLVSQPLLAIAEAKRQDFVKGWGQCLAEMVACQKINGQADITIYGIVSTGIYWEFGKLSGDVFTKNLLSYAINDPARVLGLLDYVFAACEQQISSIA